ncbi:helix-turn-helix transcriptional regulator [Lactobacillus sp. CC-MHH1034]|nr:helix-turn-helix transcriptional regulator [Agrilactobacillus fermenti]
MWKKIDKALLDKGLSLTQLALQMNVYPSVLSELKQGRIKKPSFELMVKIADALDISLDEFREVDHEKTTKRR